MTERQAIREIDAFMLNAGFQSPGFLEDDQVDDTPEATDEEREPEESVRCSDKVTYEERLAQCACEGPEFDEYLKIYNGDRTLAEYWFKKWKVGYDNGREEY